MTVPTYYIEKSDKLTHSRTITLENLIELFKEKVGAPETAKVLFNYSLGELKRKIEIIWTDDEATEKTLGIPTETTYGGHPAETPFEEWSKPPVVSKQCVTKEVATGEVQDGDLVMVQRTFKKWNSAKNRYEQHIGPWLPEIVLPLDTVAERAGHFMHVPGTVFLHTRHLTDEERAKIKRI